MAEAVCYSRSSSDQSVRREADRSVSAEYDSPTPHRHALSHLDRFHDPFHARYRRREASKSKGEMSAAVFTNIFY